MQRYSKPLSHSESKSGIFVCSVLKKTLFPIKFDFLLFCIPILHISNVTMMSWSEVSGVEQYLHKDYVVISHFCPNVSLFSIRFLSPKKTFIPSYRASFSLKITGFKCEGLNFQVFTAEEAFIPLTS